MVAGAPESNLHSAASNNNNLYPLIKRGKLKTECEWKIPTKSNMRQFNMQGKGALRCSSIVTMHLFFAIMAHNIKYKE